MPVTTLRANATERTYAKALLDLAQESGQLEPVMQETRQLLELARGNEQLTQLLGAKGLTALHRAEVIDRLFKGRVSDLMYRFLLVANRRGRLDLLPGILQGTIELYEQRHGQVEVHAFVAHLLDEPQAQAIAQRVGAALKRTAVLKQHEDPALLGGLKLLVGDELYDGSVATQLKLMRHKMIDAGRTKAKDAK